MDPFEGDLFNIEDYSGGSYVYPYLKCIGVINWSKGTICLVGHSGDLVEKYTVQAASVGQTGQGSCGLCTVLQ